ncbi:conserved hypothetical protein [Leishmania major strain Friedlin]|uniref:Uncharacterized protein n=1 Tax=Leishmania major TaxID=5664 RepID=Q4Q2B8_LEIMA|nr:conserved hypothetical protein [Leishmania major strain Friedlin]CAJ08155.1 conserved hypothetical protein [Leishmania major strain Friedlin]|eukprot:XP_001686530.1 conserved hypothetical protein [Leishmania major strain Friedlin]
MVGSWECCATSIATTHRDSRPLSLCHCPFYPNSPIYISAIRSRDTGRPTGAAPSLAFIRPHRKLFGACRAFHQLSDTHRLTAMSQLSIVKDQLLSKGINHFVVLSSSGQVVEYSGDFENKEKQVLAYAILQQCSALLAKGELMKRVTMKFDDVLYVATTVQDSATVYGVVAKRPTNGATM